MFFVVSNFKDNFSDKLHIINPNEYNDITNYEYFRYTYKFDKSSNDEKIIRLYFNNSIHKNKFLNYQIKNINYPITEKVQVKAIPSNKSIDESKEIFNITKYLNETINIEITVTSFHTINSFDILIFYSEHGNILILNSLIEDNYLNVYPVPIKERDYNIFFDCSKLFKDIVLNIEISYFYKKLSFTQYFYGYYTNKLENYEGKINSGEQNLYKVKEYGNNKYQIEMYKKEDYKSIIFPIKLNTSAIFHLSPLPRTIINSYDKINFELKADNFFILYEVNINKDLIEDNKLIENNNNKFLYFYFNKNSTNPINVSIYTNYSDININQFNKEIKNFFVNIESKDTNYFELKNIYEKLFIVVSDVPAKNSKRVTNENYIQIIKSDEYYDISSYELFKFNFKFNQTKDMKVLLYKINTKNIKNKYLHFQINNYKSSQIENIIFKNSNGDKILYENNCINITDYPNQIIFMDFGLSSIDSMDNYDILIKQSNYYLFYPFNSSDLVEIPIIKSCTFYIFSNLSQSDGYTFISNFKQEEVEYFYLELKELDESKININNLKPKKINVTKTTKRYNCFEHKEEIKNFTVYKNKHKAVVLKINIVNETNFIMTREENTISYYNNYNFSNNIYN